MTRKINTRVKKQNGKGVIDTVANMVLSSKYNRLLPGGKHMIIYLPDGTITLRFMRDPEHNYLLC